MPLTDCLRCDTHTALTTALIVDAIWAEVQVLYFLSTLLWDSNQTYVLLRINSSTKGDDEYLWYNSIRLEYAILSAFATRLAMSWLLFDGFGSSRAAFIRAGTLGSACTTFYICVGRWTYWIGEFCRAAASKWQLALALAIVTCYGSVSSFVHFLLWKMQTTGSLRFSLTQRRAYVVFVFGTFVGFAYVHALIRLVVRRANSVDEP